MGSIPGVFNPLRVPHDSSLVGLAGSGSGSCPCLCPSPDSCLCPSLCSGHEQLFNNCSAADQQLLITCSAAAQQLLNSCSAADQQLLTTCSAAAQHFLFAPQNRSRLTPEGGRRTSRARGFQRENAIVSLALHTPGSAHQSPGAPASPALTREVSLSAFRFYYMVNHILKTSHL